MTKDPCGRCGSTAYYRWQKVGDEEACNECTRLVDSSPRDAEGNIIRLPTDRIGQYSYATGEVLKSSHSYADWMKKNNMMLSPLYAGRKWRK